MKEIRFKLKDLFPTDQILARWILTLSRIHNDLIYANGYLLKSYDDQEVCSDGEIIYFTRLGISHYREAVKFIDYYKENQQIIDFISTMSSELQEDYKLILSSVAEPFRTSFVKQYIQPIRDNFFHYFDKTVEKKDRITQLGELNDYETLIIIKGDRLQDIDLVYADEISVFISFGEITEEDLKQLIAEISKYLITLMNFAYSAISCYISRNINKVEVSDVTQREEDK